MCSTWALDDYDKQQEIADAQWHDWQEAERRAREVGRRLNWNNTKMGEFAQAVYDNLQARRGMVSSNTDDIPF